MKKTKTCIVTYPGCMKSAVYGLQEMLELTNALCERQKLPIRFETSIVDVALIEDATTNFQVVVLPPNIEGKYYLNPSQKLIEWLTVQHQGGGILCSTCAGAFILAATQLLNDRTVTTHWDLAPLFRTQFSNVSLDAGKILINNGDIITAGGLMAWLDLGLELVAGFTNLHIVRELGKVMVLDTGHREQRYYQSFKPNFDHGDSDILKSQHHLQTNYGNGISISSLARLCYLTERTYLRRFVKATGMKPSEYLQRIRIQKACEQLETTTNTIEVIAHQTGYADSGAFRKLFTKTMGLSPGAFRRRFRASQNS